MSVKEIKVCIPEEQYNITQEKLSQFRLNKGRSNFLAKKITKLNQLIECEKRSLDILDLERKKVQTKIDSITKELEILYSKSMTRKIRLRIQSLNGLRGSLCNELENKLTKARIYRTIKSINSTLMYKIQEYRKKLEQNQTLSRELKEIVANNVNWCEITE